MKKTKAEETAKTIISRSFAKVMVINNFGCENIKQAILKG